MATKHIASKSSDVSFRPSDGMIVQTDYDANGNVFAWSELTIDAAKERVKRFQGAIGVAELLQSNKRRRSRNETTFR